TVAASALLAAGAFAAETVAQSRRVARERDRASTAATKARALNDFLERTLLSPDPIDGIGKDATMVQALDSAVARLGRDGPAAPGVEASLKGAMGYAYSRLALYDKAEPLLASALAVNETLVPRDSESLSTSLVRMAQLHDKRARYDSAGHAFDRAI